MADSPTSRIAGSGLTAVAPVRAGTLPCTAALTATLFLTMLPVTVMVPALKELVAERFDASSFWTHSFMSINMVGAILAAPIGGALADRLGKRKQLLVAALLANATLILTMAYVPTLATLLTVRLLEGAAHIIAVSTIMAIACDWAPPRNRGRMMGWIGASLILGTACGAPLGGHLARHSAITVFYAGTAFSLAAAIIATIALHDAPARKQLAKLRDAVNLVRTHRDLLVPYAYTFIDRFCVGVIISSFVLYLSEIHGLLPSERGNLLAFFLFPFALLCYPMGRLADRFGRTLPMCVGSIAFGAVFALYGFLPFGWLPVAMVASGVLSAVMFAPNLAMCSDLTPPDRRATAYAGFNVAGSLGFMCGPLIGGTVLAIVANRTSPLVAYQTAFVVAGTTEVLCALLTLPRLRALQKRGLTR